MQDYLEDNGINILYDTSVKDVIIENGVAVGVETFSAYDQEKENPKITNYYAEKVVIAIGRKGADWSDMLCKRNSHHIGQLHRLNRFRLAPLFII